MLEQKVVVVVITAVGEGACGDKVMRRMWKGEERKKTMWQEERRKKRSGDER